MTDTSRRTSQVSLNDPELGSFSNVDEIFKKLNISQIQQLTKKYKTVIDSTKTDLHNLVGSKYRDLIKIAEDIDDMYQTSNDIDSRIQQLSYKPTKFVSIYLDNYGKFDTYRRQQNALTTKKETRAIIVRNVINKKLNKLDQKIRLGNSPLIHTSNFIYYAKVYYTIETLFKDIIDKDESVRVFFYQLKNNLNNYLESELACYNLPESIVHSNDKFKPSQRLNTDDLVMSNAQILLQDDFDIEFEVDDDELDDDNYDSEEAGNAFEVDEIVNSKLESYDRNTLVISNYLISYSILNGGNVLVSSKFVELRIAYINGLLKELRNKSSLDQVNFYQIFKFLEHTCTYVDNYFEKDTSDYYRILSHVTKPWNATTLIGHKVWIEDELIQLDVTTRSNFDHDSKFLELVKLVFDFTIESLPEDNTKFDSLTLTVFVFHNFLVSLKRLQDSAELSGFDSKLVSVMAKTDLLKNLLNKVTSFINASYVKHVSRLTSETDGSLSQLIELKLKSDFEQHSSGMQMFTPNLVNLMDVNTEIYIQILSGDKQVQEGTDAIVGLTEWFKECEKYNRIVKTKSEDSRNSKLDAFKCISHLHTYLQNITWGSFKVEIFDDEFKQLSTIMDDLFWKQISEFHDFISKLGESVSSVEKVVYITGIISQLKSKIANINKDSVSFASNNESIDKLSIALFKKLVHDIPNIEFFNLIENSILDCINDEDNDISIRPNLKLTSAMYKLANEYLKIAEISNNLDIFLNSEIRDCFITSKNKWIKEELISTRFIQSVEKFLDTRKKENFDDKVLEENLKDDHFEEEEERSKDAAPEEEKNDDDSNSNNSNDESSDVNVENKNTDISSSSKSVMINGSGTISKSQALAILANYTFLLHFHVAKVQLEDTDFLIQLLKQHYSGDFEKSTLTIVVDGVASFYRSHKNIYSPLLIVE